jgi:hypothetical protein
MKPSPDIITRSRPGAALRAAMLGGCAGIMMLASGCVDSREEYWIDSRGGGRGEISLSIPAAALRLHGGETGVGGMIDSFARGVPGVELSNRSVEITGERARVHVAFEFGSALDLADVADGPALQALPAAVRHLTGNVEVSLRGRELSFIRQSTPGRAFPVVPLLSSSRLDGQLVTIIHLPARARESNATRTENGGRTLIWETPLATAVKAPLVTRFKIDVPVPWLLVLGVALPLALAGGFLLIRRFSPTSERSTK